MRRLTGLGILSALVAVLALALGSRAEGSSTSQFDVIFDDARGLVNGQLIKIAGARAGTIENVVVTPTFRARVEANVDSRFMPFHRDATCAIRPEALISEYYIDCDPGSPNSPPLQGGDGQPPTVPVQNTTEPVGLLDLFNLFDVPTRERLQVLIDELGIGTAARGEDFNAILRRANPALDAARQAISILTRQRSDLTGILDSTNTILHEASTHTGAVTQFLDQAAALSELTAAHRDPLQAAVARLPGLLAAAQPALAQLNTVAVQGTPLLTQLRAAVPGLNRAAGDLGPFVAAAKPALAQLKVALRQAVPTVRHTTPLVRTVRNYAQRSLPATLQFSALAKNLQQHGFTEYFLTVPYTIASALSRYDSISHMLSILLVGAQNGMCGNYATTPVPGCSAHFGSAPAYTPTTGPRR